MATSSTMGDHLDIGAGYHVFRQQGRNLLLSLERSSVIRITDDALFELLEELERDPSRHNDVDNVLASKPWPQAQRRRIRAALVRLQPWTSCVPGQVPSMTVCHASDVVFAKITLMVSEACNLRCRYCYTGLQVDKHRTQLMRPEVAQAAVEMLIRFLPAKGAIRIVFFGGEPLLNMPVIRYTIDYARRRAADLGRKVAFGLTTNGVLLDEQTTRYFTEVPLAPIISIDGPEWCHDRYRVFPDGSGSHAAMIGNLQRFRKHAKYLSVRATWTPSGAPLTELNDYFYAQQATVAHVTPVMPTHSNNLDGEFGTAAEVAAIWTQQYEALYEQCFKAWVARQPERCPLDPLHRLVHELNRRAPNTYERPCTACFSCAAVGADGTIYPCHRFWPLKPFAIGNVFTGFAFDRVRAFFKDFDRAVTDNCQTCWARFMCNGGCFRSAADEDGGFVAKDPAVCAQVRTLAEKGIGWYALLREEYPDVLKAMLASRPCISEGPRASIAWTVR